MQRVFLHRAAQVQRHVLINRFVQHIAQHDIRGLIQRKSKRAVRVVVAGQNHASVKIRVAKERVGNQQFSFLKWAWWVVVGLSLTKVR